MSNEWPLRTIEELASPEPYATQIGPFGEKIRAETYTGLGAPVLRGTNVNPAGRFHDDDFVFIDHGVAEREFSKFICEAGDVVLCHKGTLGKIGIIPTNCRFPKYVMGNSMMRVRCNRAKLVPLYLYYWLCSPEGQHYLFSRVSQVGVPQIQRPLTTLREAVLRLPPLAEQHAIVAILGALDDKIELNRRMNETLQELARTIFKSWFVDFDPVRAKAEGRRPVGMDAETAALFPSRFVESELGEVPEKWGVRPVYELASYINGAAYRDFHFCPPSDGLPIVKIAELKAGVTGQTKFTNTVLDERYRIDTGDMLFSWSGNPDTSIDTFIWTRGPAWLNQHIFKVVPRCANERLFVFRLLRHLRPVFAETARNKQTTGLGHVTAGDLKRLTVPLPTVPLLAAFDRVLGPLHARWFGSLLESQTLAELRDLLLPKLISGELRVPTAEKIVEAAL